MILLKQKRKTYTPPGIEVTEYEEEVMGGGVTASVYVPNQQGNTGFGDDDAKAGTSWIDDYDDDGGYDDFDYHSYIKEQLW